MRRLFLLLLSLISSQYALATDLIDVYQAAVNNDPIFQSATATRLAAGEQLPQSWAGLLPQLSFSANTSGNRFNNQTNNLPSTGVSRYNSKAYQLNLSQTLINFNAFTSVSVAQANVAAANANYAAAAQDLIIRVAIAYFNVLSAQDNLKFTQAQKAAVTKQWQQAKARFNAGMDTATAVANAKASYDALIAQEIADKNNVVNQYELLQTITNTLYNDLAVVKQQFPLVKPIPSDIQAWLKQTETGNATIQAMRYSADAAKQAIRAHATNHLPTVSVIGNYGYMHNTVGSNSANNVQSLASGQASSIGLQLNMPLLQGGLVNSQTRQAQDNYAKARADLENVYRSTIASTYQTYNNVLTGISKIQADAQAVRSAQSALTSNESAMHAGTMTMVDVLNAQQALYNARKIYTMDQYNYLISTLQLKQAAGTLNEKDLRLINTWLVTAN